jgi:hypothetical protein
MKMQRSASEQANMEQDERKDSQEQPVSLAHHVSNKCASQSGLHNSVWPALVLPKIGKKDFSPSFTSKFKRNRKQASQL